MTYPDSPHGLTYTQRFVERSRQRFAENGLPVYSAARYVDLPESEQYQARRECAVFGTGPYVETVAMLDEFDRIVRRLEDFPSEAEAFGAVDPLFAWSDPEVNL